MPLVGLRCPDGEVRSVSYCLNECTNRCITAPMAWAMTRDREWNGRPSTTQLLNGTMMEFLKITNDYIVDPQDRAYMVLGIRHHAMLEEAADELNLSSETALSPDDRDIYDLLEPTSEGWTLTDYKTWGSFRVARALGMMEIGKEPDPSGAKYRKNGKWGKIGDPKMVPMFSIVDDKADLFEQELQLNNYRVMLKKRGLVATKMQLQVTVRDGGLEAALSKGITKNLYLIPIRELPDSYVEDYFSRKEFDLQMALSNNKWTIPCDERESWGGRRCKGYCEVAEHCPKGRMYME